METSNLHLTSIEKLILDKIDANVDFFVSNNLRTLAQKYYVGQATIIRLVKKLGFSNLKGMQLKYASELTLQNILKIGNQNNVLDGDLQQTLALTLFALLETQKELIKTDLETIVEHFYSFSTIVIFSLSNTNYAADYLHQLLLVTGKNIIKINSLESFFTLDTFINTKNLLCIIFCHSGLSKEAVQAFKSAQLKKWTTLWIGSHNNLTIKTPLTEATYKLFYHIHENEQNNFTKISKVSGQFFIVNILATRILKKLPKFIENTKLLKMKINK